MKKGEISRAEIKENNGGGLLVKCYDKEDNILAVITVTEYQHTPNSNQDVIGMVSGEWDYTDASQQADDQTKRLIAVYDGKDIERYPAFRVSQHFSLRLHLWRGTSGSEENERRDIPQG